MRPYLRKTVFPEFFTVAENDQPAVFFRIEVQGCGVESGVFPEIIGGTRIPLVMIGKDNDRMMKKVFGWEVIPQAGRSVDPVELLSNSSPGHEFSGSRETHTILTDFQAPLQRGIMSGSRSRELLRGAPRFFQELKQPPSEEADDIRNRAEGA